MTSGVVLDDASVGRFWERYVMKSNRGLLSEIRWWSRFDQIIHKRLGRRGEIVRPLKIPEDLASLFVGKYCSPRIDVATFVAKASCCGRLN
uniref:hypothetical protein n=1 Tax=Natronorubrum halophilum TaxID=1702106 RepID=UPI000EF645CA|nr:hypothetical protein [Natronorubrum halophilum]